MASVFDVAKYILENGPAMSTMKLQKLCYYAQAWSLVWDEAPLFPEKIQAWANGPVCPDLYREHKGRFSISAAELSKGQSAALNATQRETIDAVLRDYGEKSGQWLSDLTHYEAPWRDARRGCAPLARCDNEITPAAIAMFYGSLDPQNAVTLG